MAIVISADGQALTLSTFPTSGDFTIAACWRTDGALSTFQPIIALGDFAAEMLLAKNGGAGGSPSYYVEDAAGGGSTGGSAITTNVWYAVALVRDTTASPDNWSAHIFNAWPFTLDTTITRSTDTAAGNGTLQFGNSNAYSATDGCRIGNCKAWTRALTTEEIQRELRDYRVIDPASLWGHWPMIGGDATRTGRDWSGNGRTLSESGTLGFDAGPPIPFSRRRVYVFSPTAAAGAISGTSAGTSTASATLVGTGALAAAVAGTSTSAASIWGAGALAGSTAGTSTASGTIANAAGAISGASAGTSTASATLVGSGALTGSTAGTCTVAGSISGIGSGVLAGSSAGTSTVTGALGFAGWDDAFDGNGALRPNLITYNSGVHSPNRTSGRYRSLLSAGSQQEWFDAVRGRVDCVLLEPPFDIIARNAGIGTAADSQSHTADNDYNFAMLVVFDTDDPDDLGTADYMFIACGERGGPGHAIEGKSTVSDNSSASEDSSANPSNGRADLRMAVDGSGDPTFYWDEPSGEDWNLYDDGVNTAGEVPAQFALTVPASGKLLVGFGGYGYLTTPEFVITIDALETTNHSLAGSTAGTSTATGTTSATMPISGTATGAATASGSLVTDRVSGAIAGTSTATATLSATGTLAGASAGTSTAAAQLSAGGALAGTAAGATTVVAQVWGKGALAGTTAGTSTASSSITSPAGVSGSAAGTCSVTGLLAAQGALAAALNGTSTASASIWGQGELAGTTAGTSTAVATLQEQGALSAAAAGASTAVAIIGGSGNITGAATGTSTALGAITNGAIATVSPLPPGVLPTLIRIGTF